MRNRLGIKSRIAVLVILAGVLASCSGGGQGLDPLAVLLFNFAPGFGGVHLNAPLELTFTSPVDPNSVTPDTIRIFTTTTTTAEPDPGAPAIGAFDVIGNVVRFLPRIPQNADLSDAGLRLGFTYTIQVPASPDVIDPIRTIEGDPNMVNFTEFFTTLNTTILPAPSDVTAEPNLNSLSLFFIDEGIENGVDPCPRGSLPLADRDSPQVIDSVPDEGESGFGTITGIQVGLGTAFVRLDPLTLLFSEPISPWRIRSQNISIRNTNLGGETFDLFFFFAQDRSESRLQMTVFDADSPFDQASVPQGRYILTLTDFTDLAGNPLVNSSCTAADGTFALSFSTVSSPSLPTNLKLTFQDNDGDSHVDVGGLLTAVNNPNEFPAHEAPFLSGVAVDQDGISPVSPSNVTTTANWGSIAFWTGCEVRFDNGFDPLDPAKAIPDAMRLRGGSFFAATPILAPIAGNGAGRSSTSGSLDGSVTTATANLPAPPAGKVNFSLVGSGTATLFTGDLNTGPITYHYYDFELRKDIVGGDRPTLTARSDSVFPLCIFVENSAHISGVIDLDGGDGEFGFNGANDGSHQGLSRNQGGLGGSGFAGGGDGGNGGASTLDDGSLDPAFLNGQPGQVGANVLGPLDQFDEVVAGLTGNAPGGGGHWVFSLLADPSEVLDPPPVFQGGGGAGTRAGGAPGSDLNASAPGESDQGVGGKLIGTGTDFSDPVGLSHGGHGGGGGGAEDDNTTLGSEEDANNFADTAAVDDGGGGGGAGGGFFGFTCGGDIDVGLIEDPNGVPDDGDEIFHPAFISVRGGRGGSTYATVDGDPPVPGSDASNPDPQSAIGQGNAGGGGGGGGICMIAGGQLNFIAAEIYAVGKRGGNSAVATTTIPPVELEAGGRTAADEAGSGGGGVMVFLDSDGFSQSEIGLPIGLNAAVQILPDIDMDLDGDGTADMTPGVDDDRIRDIVLEGSDGTFYVFDIYGDDPREILFQPTRIVTEFFDTLSDSVSYDRVQILSNAPAFPYDPGTLSNNVMRCFVDVVTTGTGGLPDLSTEAADGTVTLGPSNSGGVSNEVGSHFNSFTPVIAGDPAVGADMGAAQYDSTFIIPAGGPEQGRRFVRVRLLFDLSKLGTLAQLLSSFAPAGAGVETIADDPLTLLKIDNTLGNIDSAPVGVPAYAEVRVRFTP